MDSGELGVYEINKPALPIIEEFASDVKEGLSCQKKILNQNIFMINGGHIFSNKYVFNQNIILHVQRQIY